MPSLSRWILAVLVVLLGAMLGRGHLSELVGGGLGERAGWIAGGVVGLLFAFVLLGLTTDRQNPRRSAFADRVLTCMALLAVGDIVTQLARVRPEWLWWVTTAVYVAGLVTTVGSLMRPGAPPRQTAPPRPAGPPRRSGPPGHQRVLTPPR